MRLRQHPEVLPRLHALYMDRIKAGDTPGAKFVSDMTMYAEIGRDRRKLGPEYVDKVETHLREQNERFAKAFGGES